MQPFYRWVHNLTTNTDAVITAGATLVFEPPLFARGDGQFSVLANQSYTVSIVLSPPSHPSNTLPGVVIGSLLGSSGGTWVDENCNHGPSPGQTGLYSESGETIVGRWTPPAAGTALASPGATETDGGMPEPVAFTVGGSVWSTLGPPHARVQGAKDLVYVNAESLSLVVVEVGEATWGPRRGHQTANPTALVRLY